MQLLGYHIIQIVPHFTQYSIYEAAAAIVVITTLAPIEGTTHYMKQKTSGKEVYMPHMKLMPVPASYASYLVVFLH